MNITQNGMVATLMTLACVAGNAFDDKSYTDSPHNADQELTEFLAGRLMLMNHSTILMSDMAARETSTESVQKFAGKLQQAHAAMNRRLAKIAPNVQAIATLDSAGKVRKAGFRGSPPHERDDAPNRDQSAQKSRKDQRQNAKQNAHHAAGKSTLHRLLGLERQATENYLQTSTEMLSRYKGQDFDMGFLGFQIGSHTWALAELNALDSVGDEKFQKLVDEAIKTTEQHLRKARELSKQFEDAE